MAADLSTSIAQLLRAALAAFIIIQFIRRILKSGAKTNLPPSQARPPRRDPSQLRDEPPPPENPHLG